MEHQKILKGFQNLFPKTLEMSTLEKDEFISLIDFYNNDLADNNKDILISELKLWQRKILALDKQPKNAMDALIICNDMYPNIYKLLQILATLPVSTASSERSFLSLKRIKTYLRNTMSEKRLNGLAILSIHRSISVDAKEVLDELSTDKRRVDFIL
ncbi:52 kDa repressor of the inhibitor of the protein kinase-like [Rhopalosiphum padi]|uniref:52 kDa repressor of the inhibitor of the protein kinase-like n=1 Tax=Rhopalosiphum padi TaxID=40932 RepID=UPI00298DDD83|nr:52 kDa repressor of the inhibitor of the protein kinase-like [Rhopalosiphum padi]